jgi:hypothetical protein
MKNGALTLLLIMPSALAQTFSGLGGDSLNNQQLSAIDVDSRFRIFSSTTLTAGRVPGG